MKNFYSWIIEHATIIGLSIDFLALAASIVLTIFIYRLERRHEAEREKAEDRARHAAIKEAAGAFLVDNAEEIDYLPLAEIAAKLKLKRKHCRNIITQFLRCSEERQKEILRQANIPDIQVSLKRVSYALDSLKHDFDEHQFGREVLYDGAKYLHRAFENWQYSSVEEIETHIFDNPFAGKKKANGAEKIIWNENYKISLYKYMDYYLNKESDDNIERPIDMVYRVCNLGSCHESIMTFWTMQIIINGCLAFNKNLPVDFIDDNILQTQEDMYYYTLSILCAAYPMAEVDNVQDK